MHPTLLRRTLVHAALIAIAALALVASGCAKKGAAPPTPPPANSGGTPTPTDPNAGGNTGGQTNPGNTGGATTSTATAASLRVVYFELDSYAIGASAQSDLEGNAKLLRDNPSLRVTIEGHCDERGTVEYNLALGQKRADAVRDWLLGAGVPAGQLATLTKGKEFPADEGHDEAAWARNRRAEFK